MYQDVGIADQQKAGNRIAQNSSVATQLHPMYILCGNKNKKH